MDREVYSKIDDYIDLTVLWSMELESIKLLIVMADMYAKNTNEIFIRSFYDIRRHIKDMDISDEQLYAALCNSLRRLFTEEIVSVKEHIYSCPDIEICVDKRFGGSVEIKNNNQIYDVLNGIFRSFTDSDIGLILKMQSQYSIALYILIRMQSVDGDIHMTEYDLCYQLGIDIKWDRYRITHDALSPAMVELNILEAFEVLSGYTQVVSESNGISTVIYTLHYVNKRMDCDNAERNIREYIPERTVYVKNNKAGDFGRYKQREIDFEELGKSVFVNL